MKSLPLYIGLLLPCLSLLIPVPALPSISLDEWICVISLPFTLILMPWRHHKTVFWIIVSATVMSVINFGLFRFTAEWAVQVINILAFFSFFAFAMHRLDGDKERIGRVFTRVFIAYTLVGVSYIVLYYAAQDVLIAITVSLGQSNTAGAGIVGMRYTSLFIEPSHYVQFGAFAATYFIFRSLRGPRAATALLALLAVATLVLTRSALAIPAVLFPIALFVVLRLFSKAGLASTAILAGLVLAQLQFSILPEEVSKRFSDLIVATLGGSDLTEVNATSGSLALAYKIAGKTIVDTSGAGIGLGAYNQAFRIHATPEEAEHFYNQTGGGSLLIRILTELGVPALLAAGLLSLAYLPLGHRFPDTETAMRWAAFAVIAISALRLEGYTTGLLPFAILLAFSPAPSLVRSKRHGAPLVLARGITPHVHKK